MAIKLRLLVIVLVAIRIGENFNLITTDVQDKWIVVVQNVGVEAMPMTTLYTNKVVIFDITNFLLNTSILLSNGRCHNNPTLLISKYNYYVHLLEYNSIHLCHNKKGFYSLVSYVMSQYLCLLIFLPFTCSSVDLSFSCSICSNQSPLIKLCDFNKT